ncbi:MAG: N-acetylmuramoyl-L-alanine amidase, partial [Clostridia bacterium]|nr:N-acetylmuramoyl-L-alanine amidase [Clostridia bacterium]
ILIEYGFVSNISECQMLQDAGNRDILAAATVEGIKKYISAS